MTGLGRWTLPPSALHVRWTGREKAIQGNFYSPTMRMQGISFTPFFFVCLFLNTMFPNEHLAFAQFVSGEHRPCWMPSGCRETHDHFREQLCQPLPRKPGPCSLRGRRLSCRGSGQGSHGLCWWNEAGQVAEGTPAQGPSQVQRPQFTCLCWGPRPLPRLPSFQTRFQMAETDRSTEDHNLDHFDLDFAVTSQNPSLPSSVELRSRL